ncbi:mobilization protein, partial [Phocaeicola vulgatus]
MKEHSIKSVRLTPTVKARLDTFKGSDTVSVCVDRMITFFEITGFNPRYASKNPTALVEKRIEDLIKIIKSQERDIFKPILDKLAGMGGGLHESPDYARLMN